MASKEIKALFPRQWIGDWTNPQGVFFRVFEIYNIESGELVKVFLEPDAYVELAIQSIIKEGEIGNVYVCKFEEDPRTDKKILVSVKKK